jgi:glycosyltransferase involved in cell wall biosynthesis
MTHEPQPLVGVVIPVYNDWAGLQRCLQALARQSYPSDLLRVRVVDNGSSDWPPQPLFPRSVEVIRHAKPGSYGARNKAALEWEVDVLAFTDADCEPDPHWIAAGVQALQLGSTPPRVVAGRIQLVARLPDQPSPGEQLDQILGFDQQRTVRRAGFAVTANLLISQAFFQQLGGFHRKTRSGGDRDLCHRAVAQAGALVFAPDALVRHPARGWDELIHKQRRIVGGRLFLADDNPLARLLVLFLSLRPIVSETLRVCQAQQLSWQRKATLISLVIRLRAAVFREWLRLLRPSQEPLR